MINNRRDFIKGLSALGILSAVPGILLSEPATASFKESNKDNKIWACLLHLSFNFAAGAQAGLFGGIHESLYLSEPLWDDAIKKMSEEGLNMVVFNLDDSIKWESHPEIAVKDAWSTKKLTEQLKKMRELGLEPIPMLNFSTTHDAWLGNTYSRMVSTQKYYDVCRDLIEEAMYLFDNPRFFHLGMDEENAINQRHFDYIVVRQNDLWWGDFYFLIGEVQKKNSRPWVWSDYLWHHPELFLEKMPKSVLQSNWYYGENFDTKTLDEQAQKNVTAYNTLNQYGYDQMPTGKYSDPGNKNSFHNTVEYCSKNIADHHLFGFLQTFWVPTVEKYRSQLLEGIHVAGEAKKWYESNNKQG